MTTNWRRWRDEEIVLVGAIEHFSYCPRQFGLIHLESTFDENMFTIKGHFAHERPDEPVSRVERGKRIERALPIWSDEHGLRGQADVVEFDTRGVPFPVEYKSGRARKRPHEFAQLCAQALCLEEMFGKAVRRGAVYYVASKSRVEQELGDDLRERTLTLVQEVRRVQLSGRVPPPVNDGRCRNCSLHDACQPGVVTKRPPFDALFDPLPEKEPP